MLFRFVLLLFAISGTVPLRAQPPKPELPRVLLLGDSIRMGYGPLVAKRLEDVAVVVFPKDNCGDTARTLRDLDGWIAGERPAVIHWNNGLHDLKKLNVGGTYQVPVEEYEKNLLAIHEKLNALAPGRVIFANTTPILDELHAKRKADFGRFEEDVKRYNEAAMKALQPKGMPIHDLHRIVEEGGTAKLQRPDGTHYTPAGYARLADAVVDCIKRQLYAMNPNRLKVPASGSDAVKAYHVAEAEQDAAVPKYFKTLKVPEFSVPKTATEWTTQRADVKATVIASLGDMPPRPKTPAVYLVSVEHRKDYRIERIRIGNDLDGEMSAMMLIPNGLTKPAPAIMWLHSSSYDHKQLLATGFNGGDEPLAEDFVKRGWVVFAPDAAGYGDRAGAGPAGASELTRGDQQMSQLKFHLWFGRTLWGMFVRDDQIALDYLCSRTEVDTKRIGATGISMGSTRSWWLAAVDDRITCMVGVACMTRYENLIHHGQLRQHGLYYFTNGILKHFDSEGVMSLIAPRPALFLTGELDAGSPADGIKVLEEKVGGVYDTLRVKDQFRSIRYPDHGHTYTPAMRKEMLTWFDCYLK